MDGREAQLVKRLLVLIAIVILVIIGSLALLNVRGLDDGLLYLQDMVTYSSPPAKPLDPNGRFGFCEQFVTLRNAQRAAFMENYLQARQIAYETLPIFDSNFNNILVRLGSPGALTIFSAHYDKKYDEPDYHGASDNSAAVCMLLVAADTLNRQPPLRPVAVLFTGEEERGLIGARAFYDDARVNNLQVQAVYNFDNIGRDGLAVRASGRRSGYAFTLPLLGELIYDGRQVYPAEPYTAGDVELVQSLQRYAPVTNYDHMIAQSDGTYWAEQGWRAVNLSSDNIYYLDITWHTFRDRVELLDQSNFEQALDLVLALAHEPE